MLTYLLQFMIEAIPKLAMLAWGMLLIALVSSFPLAKGNLRDGLQSAIRFGLMMAAIIYVLSVFFAREEACSEWSNINMPLQIFTGVFAATREAELRMRQQATSA